MAFYEDAIQSRIFDFTLCQLKRKSFKILFSKTIISNSSQDPKASCTSCAVVPRRYLINLDPRKSSTASRADSIFHRFRVNHTKRSRSLYQVQLYVIITTSTFSSLLPLIFIYLASLTHDRVCTHFCICK